MTHVFLRPVEPTHELDLLDDLEEQRVSPHDLLFANTWIIFHAHGLPQIRSAVTANNVHLLELVSPETPGPQADADDATVAAATDLYASNWQPTFDRGLVSHLMCVHFLLNKLILHDCLRYRSAPAFFDGLVRNSRPQRALFFMEHLPDLWTQLTQLHASPDRFSLSLSQVAVFRRYTLEQVWAHLFIRLLRDLDTLHNLGLLHRDITTERISLRVLSSPEGSGVGRRALTDVGIEFVLQGYEYSEWRIAESESEGVVLKWVQADSQLEKLGVVLHTPGRAQDVESLVFSAVTAFSHLPIARSLHNWLESRGAQFGQGRLLRLSEGDGLTVRQVEEFLLQHISFVSEHDRDGLPPQLDMKSPFGVALQNYVATTVHQPSDTSDSKVAAASAASTSASGDHRETNGLHGIAYEWLKEMHWHKCVINVTPLVLPATIATAPTVVNSAEETRKVLAAQFQRARRAQPQEESACIIQ